MERIFAQSAGFLVPLTSVVDDLSAQDSGHLQHSDEGLVHGGERKRGHAVPPGHLSDVHCTVTWEDTRNNVELGCPIRNNSPDQLTR